MPKARKPPAKRARKTKVREPQVYGSNLGLHDLFQRQAAEILEQSDLSEEEKQSILIAMTCPCCGAGAMSYSVKLKPKAGPRFVADDGES